MQKAAEIIQELSLGATDIPAVMGISPFNDAWGVWASKLKLIGPKEQTPAMYWGSKLEPVIAQAFAEKMGVPVEWWNRRLYSQERPWQSATPDAFVLDPLSVEDGHPERCAVLEVKTAGLQYAGDWDRDTDSEDGIPEHYYAQLIWQMSVTRLPKAWIAVLIGGQDFRVYSVPFDREAEEVLLEAGDDFWRHHVLAGVEPPLSGSESARQYLRSRYPRHTEKIRLATAEEIEVLDRYAELRALLKQGAERRKTLENQITAAIGDAEGLKWDGGKFTWKRTKDSHPINWEGLAKSQLCLRTEEEQRDLVSQYTTTKPGHRRINFDGEDD